MPHLGVFPIKFLSCATATGGKDPKPFSEFHVPSLSVSTGNIGGFLYSLAINFIFNHHLPQKELTIGFKIVSSEQCDEWILGL